MSKPIWSTHRRMPKWFYPAMRVGIAVYLSTIVAVVFITQLNKLSGGINGKISAHDKLIIMILAACIAVAPTITAGIFTNITGVNRYKAKRESLILMTVWAVPWTLVAWKLAEPVAGSYGASLIIVSSTLIGTLIWLVCHSIRWRERNE
jgi:hypothetical protein